MSFVGTERPAAFAAPAAPAPEAAPASAVGAAGCVMSWQRSSAGAWRSCAGPMGYCRGQTDARRMRRDRESADVNKELER